MSKLSRHWLLLAGAAALAACATFAAKRGVLSDEEVIRLSHKQHAEAGVECQSCHENVLHADSLKGRVLPREATCLECHADWKEAGQCNQCHVTEKTLGWPERQRTVSFSHELHLEGTDATCDRCHTELPEPGSTKRYAPAMSVCLSCHNHQNDYDQGRCRPCHVDLTRVPLKPVAYFSHQGNYVVGHRLPARTEPGVCAQCHDQSFCADCHASTVAAPVEFIFPERLLPQFIHRNDYISRHQIDASADPALCRRCHGTSFCQRCHLQNSLAQNSVNPRNPHPAGWNQPGSGSFHGPAARRDIVNCASCHDRGASSNCVACHRVSGIGGNPHPSSFLKKKDRDDIKGNPTCRVCHL